jgi:hypothetical protein
MMLIGLWYIDFIMLRYIPSISGFISFYHEMVLNFIEGFFASIEMIRWFFSLLLLISYITFNDLHMVNHPFITGIKPTWLWWMMFLICYWIQFAIVLLRNFCINTH